MYKILVVRYRFIGDTILSVPLLRNLRYAYPDAQIDMLVAADSGELVENCPYIDNLIYFDTVQKNQKFKKYKKMKAFWYYVYKLKQEKYDKAYIAKRSFSSAALCYLSGIKERVGFDTEHRGIFLTKKVPYDTDKQESLCLLDLLKADGINIKDTYLESWIRQENIDNINEILLKNNISQDKKLVAVNVTATNDGKIWDINNFARIIEYLSNEKNIQVVFLGSPTDREIYENIKYEQKLNIIPLNLCGSVSLNDSIALIKRTCFVLGNDSGNLHMASSAGIPVIGLYGPMSMNKWGALGEGNILIKSDLPCIPCGLKRKCKNDKACMNAITVEQVKNAIDSLLEKSDIKIY